MPLPTVKFNNATGSDTAASGYGPATAVSGANASFNATAVVTVAGSNLSTISAGDLFWGQTTGTRQNSIIVSVDDTLDTITCTDTFTATESSINWGVGGKRKTIGDTHSVKIFNTNNVKPGWIIQIEDAQSISAAITLSATADVTTGNIIVQGNSAVNRPIITQTANAAVFSCVGNTSGCMVKDLEFQNTNGTKTAAAAFTSGNNYTLTVYNCILGNSTNKLGYGWLQTANSALLYFHNTLITDCTINGIHNTGNGTLIMQTCVVRNCVIGINHLGTSMTRLNGCIIYGNSGDGIAVTTSKQIELINNTIHGNGGDGIDLTTAGGAFLRGYTIFNNNITGNTGYGINGTAVADLYKVMIDYNNYGTGSTANNLGARNNITAGANEITIDPGYVNAAGGNFACTGAV